MKTSNLSGVALDWAVAKCEGFGTFRHNGKLYFDGTGIEANYSSDWSQGGPIIDREINVLEKRDGYWYAWRAKRNDGYVTSEFKTVPNSKEAWAHGTTHLIAAMRCYVASKLGYEIDIPEELK